MTVVMKVIFGRHICKMSRSMDSIATNDDFNIFGTTVDDENKDQSPRDTQTTGENMQTNENTENSDVQREETDVGLDKDTRENQNIEVAAGTTAYTFTAERPKGRGKPSVKSIENRIQSDEGKLTKLRAKVQKAVSELQNAPNVVEEICRAISQVRSDFNAYHETWLSFGDFLTNIGTSKYLQELERMEGVMNNRQHFVHENITQGNERKKEILLEMRSLRSGSGSHASSMSSTALRAQARAEVAAAIKKAEMQKIVLS